MTHNGKYIALIVSGSYISSLVIWLIYILLSLKFRFLNYIYRFIAFILTIPFLPFIKIRYTLETRKYKADLKRRKKRKG